MVPYGKVIQMASKKTAAIPANGNGNDGETTVSTSAQALMTASPEFTQSVITVDIKTDNATVKVDLPNKFASLVGQPLSEDMAKIIFTHVAGQFRNNQAANAAAREKRFAKDAKPEDMPWTVAQYLDRWNGTGAYAGNPYMPEVGAGPRMSTQERIRLDAAKAVWFALVAEHNEAVSKGQPPVLNNPGAVKIDKRPAKDKTMSTEAHAAAVEAWQERTDSLYRKLLSVPKYADRIQAQIDLLLNEAGKKADAEATAATATEDLIPV